MKTDADGLLAARFAATRDAFDDSDWTDVLNRRAPRRRPTRLRVLMVVIAIVVVSVPTIAFAGGVRDFFFGASAPPIIKDQFVTNNKMKQLMQTWLRTHPAGNGAASPTMPAVDPAQAHGVIASKTSDGLLFLWAAPAGKNRECWFIDFASDQINHARATGGGSCDPVPPPAGKILWDFGWSASHPTLKIFSGRVYVPAVAVIVSGENLDPQRIPVVDRYFLATFPRNVKTPTRVTAVDAQGHVVAAMERPVARRHPSK